MPAYFSDRLVSTAADGILITPDEIAGVDGQGNTLPMGTIFRTGPDGKLVPARLSFRGQEIASLSINPAATKTDDAQPGPDQVWTMAAGQLAGFELAALKGQGQTFNSMMIPNLPLALPAGWDGVWLVSSAGATEVETRVQGWSPDEAEHQIDARMVGTTRSRVGFNFSRNREAVDVRLAWSSTKEFIAADFLVANGAIINKSNLVTVPAIPQTVIDEQVALSVVNPERAAYLGIWTPSSYEISDIQRAASSLRQSVFVRNVIQPGDKTALEVEGIDGFYYPATRRFTWIGTQFNIRFLPDTVEGGTLFPIISGPHQIFSTGISGLAANFPQSVKISLYASGIFSV